MPKKFLKKSMYRVRYIKRSRPKQRSSNTYQYRRKRNMMTAPSGSPFPPSKFCNLRYFDQYTLTQASSVPVVQQWNLNNLYDFDKTSAGHQPYYYDQLTTLYNQYRVYYVHIYYHLVGDNDFTIVFRPTSEAAAPAATAVGFDTENERFGSKMLTYSVGGPAVIGKMTFDIRKILGFSKAAYNSDDRTAGPVTSNPSEQAYLNAVMFSTGTTAVATLTMRVLFSTKFFDPVYPSQS